MYNTLYLPFLSIQHLPKQSFNILSNNIYKNTNSDTINLDKLNPQNFSEIYISYVH